MRTLSNEARSAIRRASWITYNLLLHHVLPAASGVISKSFFQVVRDLPTPFLTSRFINMFTIDGGVRTSIPSKAWAKYTLPKGLPVTGKRSLAIENEPHFADDFNGVIKEGYGKGIKTLLIRDSVIVKVADKSSVQRINYHLHDADVAGLHFDIVVTGIKPGTKQWELNIPRGQNKGRYAFVTTPTGMLVTRMKDNGLVIPKPDYTLRSEEVLMVVDPLKNSIERKLDGSLANAHVGKEGRVAFRSHREEGETYYDKLPALESISRRTPFLVARKILGSPDLGGTVFQGELVHPDGSARVSGILNSLAPNARNIQLRRGPVKYFVWDVLKVKGRDISGKAYVERRKIAETLVGEIRHVNKNWFVVERCINEPPEQFYKRIIQDPLPYGEGVVVKPLDTSLQKWDKIKMTGFGYFKLVDILPGEGKYAESVGRLVVENRQNHARGEVGSLSVPDDFRSWMWANREFLVGETIKVRSQEVTSRGVPRAGVFYGFHNGALDLLMAAEANAAGTSKTPKQVLYAMKSAKGWRKNG